MGKYILSFCCVLLLSLMADAGLTNAFVIGPSNLGVFGYPDPNCYEPTIPLSRDEWSVSRFNSDFNTYRDCIEDYLEAAKNDSQRVQEKHNEIVNKYNRFVNSIR